jgi:RNA polymerase sigma-70 factor (ECF subfamily)
VTGSATARVLSITGDTHRPGDHGLDEAVAEVFRAHASFVWRAVRRLGVPEAAAEDAVQEVFLVVHRRLAEFDGKGSMRAWLFAISRRVASHHHRRVSREKRRLEQVVVQQREADLDEEVARREAGALVEGFLEQLDEPRRMVFFLADIEGLTAPEVSAALGVKLNTVYSRLRAARRRFEALIAERDEGERKTSDGPTQ